MSSQEVNDLLFYLSMVITGLQVAHSENVIINIFFRRKFMRKRMNQVLAFSLLTIICSLFLLNTVDAAAVGISSKVLPFQKYAYVGQAEKSFKGSTAMVELYVKQNEAVTFTVKAVNDGTYGKGVVVEHTDLAYDLYYSQIYDKGTQVQARYRNHNWTANSGQIDGYFNYQ